MPGFKGFKGLTQTIKYIIPKSYLAMDTYLMSKRTETGSWSSTGSSGPRLGLRLWPLIGHVWVPSEDCWSPSLISTTTLSAPAHRCTVTSATAIWHHCLAWLLQRCHCWSPCINTGTVVGAQQNLNIDRLYHAYTAEMMRHTPDLWGVFGLSS